MSDDLRLGATVQDWRQAAMRVGEELASVGPEGYYSMTPQQWQEWALRALAAAPPDARETARQMEVAWHVDAARMLMAQQLDEALHGAVTARPQSPETVWALLLNTVRSLTADLAAAYCYTSGTNRTCVCNIQTRVDALTEAIAAYGATVERETLESLQREFEAWRDVEIRERADHPVVDVLRVSINAVSSRITAMNEDK